MVEAGWSLAVFLSDQDGNTLRRVEGWKCVCQTSYLSPETDILCHEWMISNCASGQDLSASVLSCFRVETRQSSAFFGLIVFFLLLLGLYLSYGSYAVACVVKGLQIQVNVGNNSKVYKYLKS